MRKIFIIGIGAGNPDFMTVQAVKALNQVDVFFIPNKGAEKEDLRRLRQAICDRFATEKPYRMVDVPALRRKPNFDDYRTNVAEWHREIEEQYGCLLRDELADGECGGFLVWGDPTLYDSTLRIVENLRAKQEIALDYEIIPGISSVQVLAARHRIPLNRIGEPILITTGRKLAAGMPESDASVVVMLDGNQTFNRLDRPDMEIFWGAYLGTDDEILVNGRLADVGGEIERVREQARRDKGWIMDTYLLRTPDQD